MSSQTAKFEKLVASDKPVLIDFYADWCGPCKMFAHTIDNLKKDVGSAVRVVKVNIDKNQGLSQQLQVRSIPTVMIYQNGEMKWRATGAQSIQTMKSQLSALTTLD